jgi:hypothetical protein
MGADTFGVEQYMRYIIDIDPKTEARIREFITAGRYLSVYQFAARAIEEMLHLEGQELNQAAPVQPSVDTARFVSQADFARLIQQPDAEPQELAAPHEPEELMPEGDRETVWLWGQINSIFCIKFTLRVLCAKQLESNRSTLPLSDVQPIVTDAAVLMGRQLRDEDARQGRSRDATFSVSFPADSDKSRARHGSQYLGYLDGNGRPRGALAWLGFARMTGRRGSEEIALTPAGFHFGALHNPLVDEPAGRSTKSALTQEEAEFYIRHILKHAPCEARSLATVCSLIKQGSNMPQSLDSALGQLRPEWSDAERVTYKTGALARLFQLGVVAKKKGSNGNVEYLLTDRAKASGLIPPRGRSKS